MAWDVTKPAGGDLVVYGDDKIRELAQDLELALQTYGSFPIDTANPVFRYRGQSGTNAAKPTPGEGGLYFDTTNNHLIRDTGATWEICGSWFDSGVVMPFYQSTAPVGWTTNSSINDRLLYVDSAAGGTTSGSWTGASDPAADHTHAVAELIYNSGADARYGFRFFKTTWSGASYVDVVINETNRYPYLTADQIAGVLIATGGSLSDGDTLVSDVGGTHSHSVTHTAARHQTTDCLLAVKD